MGLFALGGRFDHFIRHSEFFDIAQVKIEGASPELESRIRGVIQDMRGEDRDSLLLFKTSHAQFFLDALPQVGALAIEKRFPDELVIRVREREAVTAINVGELFWVDREGVILGEADPRQVARTGVAPLTGVRAPKFAPGVRLDQPRLIETLETIRFLKKSDPGLSNRFAEWHINSRDEVIGVLDEGVEVRFGAVDPIVRLPALASALRDKDAELPRFTYLDLRFDSQVVYF